MRDRSPALRRLVAALSLAVLVTLPRPAAACDPGEVECGSQCMPEADNCCAIVGLGDYYCPEGWTCWSDGYCESGTGPSEGQTIVDANGAPYGPSADRSCGIGRGGPGDGGGAAIAVAGAIAWMARRRRRARVG